MIRSIVSVLVGIAVLTAASFAIEAAVNPLLLRAFPEALPGTQALSLNPWVRLFTFAYGLLCVAAGGYVAAYIGRRLPVRHAAGVGILQSALTVMAMLSPVGTHAARWVWILTAVLSIPAALVGGVVCKYRSTSGLQKTSASA